MHGPFKKVMLNKYVNKLITISKMFNQSFYLPNPLL